jgi:hypothetical protein
VRFEANLNEDTTAVTFTRDELRGLPDSFIDALPSAAAAGDDAADGDGVGGVVGGSKGSVLVDMKAPNKVPVRVSHFTDLLVTRCHRIVCVHVSELTELWICMCH